MGSLVVLFVIAFLVYFYAADLKGVWFDEGVRLMLANGGVPTANLENRRPGDSAAVLKAVATTAPMYQPGYFLVVNWILRLTRSYSIIPIVTTNLVIFLLSGIGVYLLARRLLAPVPRFLAALLYVWNGYAMMHLLQVREYPLILFFLVYNILFFYQLMDAERQVHRKTFWLVGLAHCATAVALYYTTKWGPLFLWPQGVVALLALRRTRRGALAVLASLGGAALSAVPSLLGAPRESLVFKPHDVKIQTISFLLHRLYGGAEHLLIGYLSVGRPLLKIYCWGLLAILLFGLVLFGFRFRRERFEIQHLVLTALGFLGFQICYFFRDAISTWPRYFILYLPYLALLIPLSLSRALVLAAQPARRRNWAYGILIVIVFVAGSRQVHYNYQHPLIDHGPDFRAIYRYLIERVTPSDKIVVGGDYNQKTLLYYWPTVRQIQTRYVTGGKERANPPPNIWIVNHKFDERVEYKNYVAELEKGGYKLALTRRVSGVSIHQFVRSAPPQNPAPKSTAIEPPTPPRP